VIRAFQTDKPPMRKFRRVAFHGRLLPVSALNIVRDSTSSAKYRSRCHGAIIRSEACHSKAAARIVTYPSEEEPQHLNSTNQFLVLTLCIGIDAPDGTVVAPLSINGAEFWVADESPEHKNFSPEALGGGTVRMVMVVDDPEAAFAKAVAAGAVTVWPVGNQHGWRLGRVVDPYGHQWEIGRPVS